MTSRDQPTVTTAVPTLAGRGRRLDFALMVFPHVEAAEHAYANVIDRAAGEPWLNEVAFVVRHGHGRPIVRGTVAGHYVSCSVFRLRDGSVAEYRAGRRLVCQPG